MSVEALETLLDGMGEIAVAVSGGREVFGVGKIVCALGGT